MAEKDIKSGTTEETALSSPDLSEASPILTEGGNTSPSGVTAEIALQWLQSLTDLDDVATKSRVDRIKESYDLLRRFNPNELKILMNLKRNTSHNAWTLREDLVVLTLPLSNREIAQLLHDRNKEAVKKRLQLLRSKGLGKR